MGDRVDRAGPASAGSGVADIASFERQQARMAGELGEVLHVAGHEIVDRQDGVAAVEQLADHPAADEARRSRDEDSHAGRPAVANGAAYDAAKVASTSDRTSSAVIRSTASER